MFINTCSVAFKEICHIIFDGVLFGITAFFLSYIIAPIQYIKIIKQESGKSYIDIIISSYKKNKIKIFFRAAKQYSILNMVSSASFGISSYLSNILISYISTLLSFLYPIIKSLFGGFIETITTLKIEINEINKNKGITSKKERNIVIILFFIFMRNSMSWLGATIAFTINNIFHLQNFENFIVTFVAGLITGVISTPIDAITTRICGNNQDTNIKESIKKIIKEDMEFAFAGAGMRIIQIIIYTMLTEAVMSKSANWFEIIFAML